jgi:hypothetical protein
MVISIQQLFARHKPVQNAKFTAVFNSSTPELNPSAQSCLTRVLLGVLLLEPRISLMHA